MNLKNRKKSRLVIQLQTHSAYLIRTNLRVLLQAQLSRNKTFSQMSRLRSFHSAWIPNANRVALLCQDNTALANFQLNSVLYGFEIDDELVYSVNKIVSRRLCAATLILASFLEAMQKYESTGNIRNYGNNVVNRENQLRCFATSRLNCTVSFVLKPLTTTL